MTWRRQREHRAHRQRGVRQRFGFREWRDRQVAIDAARQRRARGHFAGLPNQFQPDYGNFLTANTDANRPAGQGYVRFSVQLNPSVAAGTVFTQQGDIIFNQHGFGGEDTPTNAWETTVIPNEVPIAGRQLTIGDKPNMPTSRKLTFKTLDAGMTYVADPRVNGFRVYVREDNRGASSTAQYMLPALGWTLHGTKYVFKSSKTLVNAIRTMSIDTRAGLVKIMGKGALLTSSLALMPTPVDLVMFDGANEFCTHFGGTVRVTPLLRYQASAAPPPSTCPTPPFRPSPAEVRCYSGDQ